MARNSQIAKPTGRELIDNVGVVRSSDAGSGLRTAASALTGLGAKLGADAEATNVALARQRGANAVTQDEAGNIKVEPLPAPDSPVNRAYLASAEQGFVSAFTNAHQTAATKLQVSHQFDAAGFATAWQGHTEGALSQVPEAFQPRAKSLLGDLGQRNADNILLRTTERDRTLAQTEWTARLTRQEDQLSSFAKAGQNASPDALKLASEYEETLLGGVASRFINEDLAQMRREGVADEGEAQALSKSAIDAYTAAGRGPNGVKAAESQIKALLDDPKIGIPEARRQRIANLAQERIRESETLRRVEVAQIRDDADDTLKKLDHGFPVDKTALFGLAGRAAAAGDTEFAGKLRKAFDVQQDVSLFARKPATEQVATMTALRSRLEAGGGTGTDADKLINFERAHVRKVTALRDDAWSYSLQAHREIAGNIPPLDFSAKPEEITASLQARGAAADRLSQLEGVPMLPVSKEELGRMQGLIKEANATQRAALSATLADGLGAKRLPVLLDALVKKDDDAKLFATAAGIATTDAAVSRRIFNGADVMKSNPKVLPEINSAARSTVDGVFGDALAARPDMRGAISEAGWALYADAQNQKGDFSGRLDTGLLRKSMEAAAGGIVEYRGAKLIPPVRGMSGAQFADTVNALTDADLGAAPLKASDGTRVTAQMVRDRAQLVSVADGRYEVRFNGFSVADPTNPARKYLLDLRSVKPAGPAPSNWSPMVP